MAILPIGSTGFIGGNFVVHCLGVSNGPGALEQARASKHASGKTFTGTEVFA